MAQTADQSCALARSHPERERPSGHREKADAAEDLAEEHGLPYVWSLLRDLNDMRKHEAYGDADPPDGLSAEGIAAEIEEYVESVGALLQS